MLLAFTVCRFLNYTAWIFLFGSSAMLAMTDPRSLGSAIDAQMRGWLRAVGMVGLVSTLCLLPLETAAITEDWRSIYDAGTLGTVLFQTRFGIAWCIRVLANMLALAPIFFVRPGDGQMARALGTGLALLPLGLTGHAAMQEGWVGVAHAVNDMVHCLAAGFWLGSLPVFLKVLSHFDVPRHRPQAARALMRFSTAGHLAVAMLLLSGGINTVLVLRGATVTLASPYQKLLLVKFLIAGTMVGLALVNRYRWVPRLRGGARSALENIRRNTVLEVAAGTVVLLLVALLGQLPPQ